MLLVCDVREEAKALLPALGALTVGGGKSGW